MSNRKCDAGTIAGGFIAALALMLAGCGGGGSESGRAPVPVHVSVIETPVKEAGHGTWVVIGSSTAAGAATAEGAGWVSLVQATYASGGVQIVNLAKGGTVTYQGLKADSSRVEGRPAPDIALNVDAALARQPVFLIVSYPTNDTALGYSVDETVQNLLAIRQQALDRGVPVMVTSTQPRNLIDAKLEQLRTIDQRLAASVGNCFVNVRQVLEGPDGHLAADIDSGDGVHPNTAGHARIAAQVKAVIDARRCVKVTAQ